MKKRKYLLELLYYRVNRAYRGGNDSESVFFSTLVFGMLLFANIVTMLNIFSSTRNLLDSEPIWIITYVSVAILIYFVFGRRYKEINEKYNETSKSEKTKNILITLIYMFLSFGLFAITSLLCKH